MSYEGLEIREQYGYVKLSGTFDANQIVTMLREVMDSCVEHRLSRMLINAEAIVFLYSSVASIFEIGTEVAGFWDRTIRVVVVRGLSPAGADLAKLVGQNRSLPFRIVATEAEAVGLIEGK